MTEEPNDSRRDNNGCVLGCLLGAFIFPCLIVGIGFLFVGVDGQFGMTMIGLIPVGAAIGSVIGVAWEVMHREK